MTNVLKVVNEIKGISKAGCFLLRDKYFQGAID